MNDNLHQPESYNAIAEAIEAYRQGWKKDIEKFRRAFDSDAWIYFVDAKGNNHKSLLENCFKQWSETNWDINCKILSLRQLGDIATVVLEFDNLSQPTNSYIDIHTLMNTRYGWKITNKTAVHRSRVDRKIFTSI